ncbi:hypothetical protein CYMTET_25760 [Cymbomonas tetramitiformis]|uniref:Uncharacterized protein n=1 Tax=Cymbomonas tetramitiformis TaxID=36881 RepID=A0AAE0FT31_9CHLO|nr:hypothetical protein CYMTET_25760 [Cymbomonas tetramitiformis]
MSAENQGGADVQDNAEHRSQLRAQMLELWLKGANSPVSLHLYDSINADATFLAIDSDQNKIIVSNLDTPIGIVPKAVIRSTDVISIVFPLPHKFGKSRSDDLTISEQEITSMKEDIDKESDNVH